MATKVGDMYAELNLKKEGFERNLTATQKRLQKFKQNAQVVFKAIAIAAAAMTAELFRATKAAMEQEKQTKLLYSLMKELKLATKEETDELIKYADAIKYTTAYSDQEIIAAMQMLGTFQLNSKQIKEIIPRLLDMASEVSGNEKRHIELTDAAKRFGMALNDNVGLLKRWGVILNEEAIEANRYNGLLVSIDENYKNMAETYVQTTEGAMKRLKNMYVDLEEALGGGLLPYLKEYIKLMTEDMMKADGLTSQLKDIGTWIGKIGIILMRFVNNTREAMTDFGAHMTNILAGTLEVMTHIPGLGNKFESAARSVRMLNIGFVEQGIALQENEDKYNKMLENLDNLRKNADKASGSPIGNYPGGGINGLNQELEDYFKRLERLAKLQKEGEEYLENIELEFYTEEGLEKQREAAEWNEKYGVGIKNIGITAEDVEKSVGELFGTLIQSGMSAEAVIRRLIGQLIRLTILKKLGPFGNVLGGFMQAFGMQHGGMTNMPMMNMRPNLAVANENPSVPEMIVPIEKFRDLVKVEVIGDPNAQARVFLDASKLPDDVKDKFVRDMIQPALMRDSRR